MGGRKAHIVACSECGISFSKTNLKIHLRSAHPSLSSLRRSESLKRYWRGLSTESHFHQTRFLKQWSNRADGLEGFSFNSSATVSEDDSDESSEVGYEAVEDNRWSITLTSRGSVCNTCSKFIGSFPLGDPGFLWHMWSCYQKRMRRYNNHTKSSEDLNATLDYIVSLVNINTEASLTGINWLPVKAAVKYLLSETDLLLHSPVQISTFSGECACFL